MFEEPHQKDDIDEEDSGVEAGQGEVEASEGLDNLKERVSSAQSLRELLDAIASVKKIPISTGKMVPSAQMVEGIETAEGLPEMRKSRKTLSLFLRTYEVTNKFGGIRNKAISFLLEKEEETSNVDEEAD